MRLSDKEKKKYRVGNGEEIPENATRLNYVEAAEQIENFYDFYPREFMRETRGTHNGGAGEMRSVYLIEREGEPYAIMVQHNIAGMTGEMRFFEQ